MVQKARILVVDDEQDILAALKSYLESTLDVEVVVASSGTEALQALDAQMVDLVISDYRMPVMDGIEFLRRTADKAPDVPRILLTAFPDMQLAIQAVNEAHILQFLTKPVEPDALLALVRKALEDSRRTRHSRQALDRAAGLGKPSSRPPP